MNTYCVGNLSWKVIAELRSAALWTDDRNGLSLSLAKKRERNKSWPFIYFFSVYYTGAEEDPLLRGLAADHCVLQRSNLLPLFLLGNTNIFATLTLWRKGTFSHYQPCSSADSLISRFPSPIPGTFKYPLSVGGRLVCFYRKRSYNQAKRKGQQLDDFTNREI